ncbi:MAG: 50S ribosomal protein L13 [Candidatus Omnitrophica bacterium]|nr:50S ribosomal protein L13 [Candidatus Omnitrophota bacterium]
MGKPKVQQSTTLAKPGQAPRAWWLVDGNGQTLGRLATRIATVLRGKHKALYTPYIDTGDFVVVINAKAIKVTGAKAMQKVYPRYSGYPGGLKHVPYERVLNTHSDRILRNAVKGMLPPGPLGRSLLTKLKIYPDAEHPHRAQLPQPLGATLGVHGN